MLILNRRTGAPRKAIFKETSHHLFDGFERYLSRDLCIARQGILLAEPSQPRPVSWELLFSKESALISPWEMQNAELLGHLASIQGAPSMCHSVLGSEDRAWGRKDAPYVPGAYLQMGERTIKKKKKKKSVIFIPLQI